MAYASNEQRKKKPERSPTWRSCNSWSVPLPNLATTTHYFSRVEKNPIFFPADALGFSFNAKNLISVNTIMVLFWHSAIGIIIGGHWALCSIISTYLQLNQIKPDFVGPHMIGFFFLKKKKL